MGLFGPAKHRGHSVALIDIEPSSIGGALVCFSAANPPKLIYATRTPISAHVGEDPGLAMVRILEEKTNELITKGAPVLRRETGTGHCEHVVVSMGAPWQKTLIRRERIQQSKPFVFTAAIQKEMLRLRDEVPENSKSAGEVVIATLLNGYETAKPFGKQAKLAELVILSSWINEKAYDSVQKAIRRAYHTHALTFTTPVILNYTVFRSLFPHEKNFLAVQITSETTDMSYVKNGILTKSATIAQGMRDTIQPKMDDATWLKNLQGLFQQFSAEQALPRTIFLVAPNETREHLLKLLDAESLRSLWLSDDPLRIIGVAPAHLMPFLSTGSETDQDLFLELFALFEARTIHTPLLQGN